MGIHGFNLPLCADNYPSYISSTKLNPYFPGQKSVVKSPSFISCGFFPQFFIPSFKTYQLSLYLSPLNQPTKQLSFLSHFYPHCQPQHPSSDSPRPSLVSWNSSAQLLDPASSLQSHLPSSKANLIMSKLLETSACLSAACKAHHNPTPNLPLLLHTSSHCSADRAAHTAAILYVTLLLQLISHALEHILTSLSRITSLLPSLSPPHPVNLTTLSDLSSNTPWTVGAVSNGFWC